MSFHTERKTIGQWCWWKLNVVCGVHNHEVAESLEGHPYAGRLTVEEKSLLEDMTKNGEASEHLTNIEGPQFPTEVDFDDRFAQFEELCPPTFFDYVESAHCKVEKTPSRIVEATYVIVGECYEQLDNSSTH
ncbi:hypothetical protein SESBI_06112 [Sesbania bispinosa]|nr:hypothetical protein SESBI_06112 [Sesbania bispinosa]